MLRRLVVLLALAAAVTPAPGALGGALTEHVTCPALPQPSGLCSGVDEALEEGGYNVSTAVQLAESTASSGSLMLVPPGESGSAELTFLFVHDGGDFQFCFGFCLRSGIDDDVWDAVNTDAPPSDDAQLAFARQCISEDAHTYQVFNDVVDNATAEVKVNITLPADVIFFLVPDDRIPTFASDPDTFWNDTDRRRPLFSLLGANPDCEDQLVLYNDPTADAEIGPTTLFLWEDKTRKNSSSDSDDDFGDLAFRVAARIEDRQTGGDPDKFLCIPGDPEQCSEATISSPTTTVTMAWSEDGLRNCTA